MRLSKHHGLRNDFLVLLDEANAERVPAGPELARRLCDRRAGIGADGLIHGARPAAGSDADVVMHLWNADGSPAEMSGNGIRCLAQAVVLARGEGSGTVVVESDTGRREIEVTAGPDPLEVSARVDLGVVEAGPDISGLDLPIAAKEARTASIGNPHLVVWVDEGAGESLPGIDLATVGPAIESHVDGGINVEVIAPASAPDTIDLRVWERGAGITQACGTGACVAAHLAHEWGVVGERVTVRMPGGEVVVELVDGHAVLHGPSVLVARMEVDEGVVLDG